VTALKAEGGASCAIQPHAESQKQHPRKLKSRYSITSIEEIKRHSVAINALLPTEIGLGKTT
jgi:hypothetical protein